MTLILRSPWTRQPASYQPLSEFALAFGLGEGLLPWSNGRVIGASATVVPTSQGLAHKSASSAAGVVRRAANIPATSGQYAGFLTVFRTITTTANAVIGALGSDAGSTGNTLFNLYLTGTNNVDVTAVYGNAITNVSTAASSVNLNDGRVHAVMLVAGPFSGVPGTVESAIYIDGLRVHTASHASTTLGTGNAYGWVCAGGFRRGGTDIVYTTQGDVETLGVFPVLRTSMPSTAEGLRLTRNAWEVFQPRRIHIPVSIAESGTGSITQADGVATTSTLAGSSVAATTPTQADGAATAATLAGSSIAAAAFTQADGVATTSTLVGSDVGGSAITSADGVATTSTLAGSSIAAADFVAAAGTSTGETLVPFGAVVASSAPIGGGIPKRRRRRYQVEVDGEVFDVDSPAEAEAVLEQVKQTAQEQAKTAVERAAKATKREPRKVLQDARRAMPAPVIDAPAELAESIARVQAEIRSIYADALRDVEIALLMRRAELEADDEDVLLLL